MRRCSWMTATAVLAATLAVAPAWGQKPAARAAKPVPTIAVSSPAPQPALGGYCPTAYLLQGKAVKGNPTLQSSYQGETYYLSSADAKRKFDAEPAKFLPRFGGLCTTALGGTYGNRFLGEPEVFDVHEKKVYLFSSERAKRAYLTGPINFISRASAIFGKPFIGGYCPVSYQQELAAIPGKETITHVFRQFTIRFATEAKRKAFIANPERYFPRYDGFCASSVAEKRRQYADANLFFVFNGATYLFSHSESLEEFTRDPQAVVTKADIVWPAVRIEALTPRSKRR